MKYAFTGGQPFSTWIGGMNALRVLRDSSSAIPVTIMLAGVKALRSWRCTESVAINVAFRRQYGAAFLRAVS